MKDNYTAFIAAFVLLIGVIYAAFYYSPQPKAEPADSAMLHYQIVNIGECEYIYLPGAALTHKGDCPNPVHWQRVK